MMPRQKRSVPLPRGFRRQLGQRTVYRWGELLDGEQHTIHQGRDFDVELPAMRDMIYMAALRRGLKATVKRKGNSFVVQRVDQ